MLAGLCLAGGAGALPRHAPVPGGVAVVDLGPAPAAPKARLGQRSLAVVEERGRWYALLGIPLDAVPGSREIAAALAGGERRLTVAVAAKDYPTQRLTIRDRRKVEPNADDLARIEREKAVTEAIKASFSPAEPETAFVLPAAGPLSSRFGLKRLFNGLPRNPHAGLDVAVGSGAPVRAPAPGRVAEVGDFFFNGHTVFVDHGQGLITAYMHLSRIDVRPGQVVGRGERLGAAGASGRVTGPHLHWAVILNGAAVDPELFLPLP